MTSPLVLMATVCIPRSGLYVLNLPTCALLGVITFTFPGLQHAGALSGAGPRAAPPT